MSTFEAIKTQRVRASLNAIRQHILGAINLTQIEGVGTAIQELQRTPLPLLPEVTNVQPNTIPYKDRAQNVNITVTGKNLDGVHAMHLIRRGEVEPWSTLADDDTIEPSPDGKSLKARFSNLGSAPSGSFNLLLIDNREQAALFADAVTIYPPVEGGGNSGQERDLQLGGIYPNGSIGGTTIPAVVVVLHGKPTEFCVTDLDGKEQSDWRVDIVEKNEWGRRFEWKPSYVNTHLEDVQQLFAKQKVELVLLHIEIPGLVKGGGVRQIFRVVGKSAEPKAEDALAFFVRQEWSGNKRTN